MFKRLIVHMRKSLKFSILFIISILMIIATLVFLFKPTYIVRLNGEQIGYTENKSKLQSDINKYIENGDNTNANLAFVQVNTFPEYEMCLLKRDVVTNDSEVLAKVKEQGVNYYRYYAVLNDGQEKYYVSSFTDAESIVKQLKDKESNNIDKITILEKYETESKEFTAIETAVTGLYVAKPKSVVKPIKVATTARSSSKISSSVSGTSSTSFAYKDAGIAMIRPTSGVVSSPYGYRRSGLHTGIDIAPSKGTPIIAAAAGTVVGVQYSNYSYGNMVIVDHGKGVLTYYAHCNTINVSYGQSVGQGQKIATVGSTGNSTGPHLHFEVRINGIRYNPANYI